jgi:putative peptide zinc metalloprotease protein
MSLDELGGISKNGALHTVTKSLCFRDDLKIYPPRSDSLDKHYVVYDPISDMSYSLGSRELMVARSFNGQHSLAEIIDHLSNQFHCNIKLEKLANFKTRLLNMGLLTEVGAAPRPVLRDPDAGISYGPFKAMLMITILRMQPMQQLDFIYARFGWLCSPAFVWSGVAAIFLALFWIASHSNLFLHDVARVYGNGLGWLMWHYPVVIASIAIHELGHALSCRAYRVRVTELGIAVYLLLATGWARPLQNDWSGLNKRQRMITILMGPYGSLLFATVGVLIWAFTPQDGTFSTLGVVMMVSSTIGLIPTLLPIFNGDAYLAFTEYLGMPRLRQRAFQYVREAVLQRTHGEIISLRLKLLFWCTVMGTCGGWLIAWVMLFMLCNKIFNFF